MWRVDENYYVYIASAAAYRDQTHHDVVSMAAAGRLAGERALIMRGSARGAAFCHDRRRTTRELSARGASKIIGETYVTYALSYMERESFALRLDNQLGLHFLHPVLN
jgi:hypothetical protein